MKLSLSDESERLIAEQVASGRYTSADDVVRQALDLLTAHDSQRDQRLSALRKDIEESIAQLERGESTRYPSAQALAKDIKDSGRDILVNRRSQTG